MEMILSFPPGSRRMAMACMSMEEELSVAGTANVLTPVLVYSKNTL